MAAGMTFMDSFVWTPGIIATIGIGYQLFGLWCLSSFFGRERTLAVGSAGVTLLKPLHGAEPRLFENLSSFLAQDYPGPVQMVCGVADGNDPAVAVVRALQAAHPKVAIDLVIDPTRHGSNRKVGNLINMIPTAQHDFLVMSDSDMAVPDDYLSTVIGTLQQPKVGAVSCFFIGRGDCGVWSKLSATIMSYKFMLDLIVSLVTKLAKPCAGATIALRRETLEQLGGFARFSDVLADDFALGEAVRGLGLRVDIPPLILTHGCEDVSLGAVWQQHLRWGVTIRDIVPLSYFGSANTHTLGWAMVALLFNPAVGSWLCLAALAIRVVIFRAINRYTGQRTTPFWHLPIADLVSFGVFIASLFAKKIEWRGAALTLKSGGRISEA